MKYPALEVAGVDGDLLLAIVDDYSPTAVEERPASLAIFFATRTSRDAAQHAILTDHPHAIVTARDVDDEDWARRSQENQTAITVGRLTISPRPESHAQGSQPPGSGLHPLTIVIPPSMGFGTGHHATTRLCLLALQHLDLEGRTVLDVGTGSGVLAIAARALGAREAIGIDSDADAIRAANENLAHNPGVSNVAFMQIDLRDRALPVADVVTANLTGTLLVRTAPLLMAAVSPNGVLIVSGLQMHERNAVAAALTGERIVWEAEEATWVGIAFNRGVTIAV